MRLRAYFTVEASYIFAFIAFLVVAFIRLDYKLHDRVVNDSCKIQAGVMRYQAKAFYYDVNRHSLDYLQIIASPIIGDNEDFTQNMYKVIEKKQGEYYKELKFGTGDINLSNTSEMIAVKKNADVVRAGGRIVEIIGDIKDEG